MPHTWRIPRGYTLIEEGLFKQQREQGELQRRVVEASAAGVIRAKEAGYSGSQDGLFAASRPGPGRELIWITQDGRFTSGGEWVDSHEYARRHKLVASIVPKPTDSPDEVETGLLHDGSVSMFTDLGGEIVHKREFFRRYRKWRRRCHTKRYFEDLNRQVESATGWRCGTDFWLLRLMGFGPRPH